MALRRRTLPSTLPRRTPLRDDERGSFVVLEAILVALLVLTAILFFTSVQRPSTGTDQGGLDLGQVAADTLSILEVRTFTISGGSRDLDGWVTNATRFDATGNATAAALEDFLGEVLPTGSRYAVRLDNGISNLTILPAGGSGQPHGARAAQMLLFPDWAAHRNWTTTATRPLLTVTPGQVIPSSQASLYDLVKADSTGTTHYKCYVPPFGNATAASLATSYATLVDADGQAYSWISPAGAHTWAAHWRGTPGGDVTWKSDVGASAQQVPRDLPYGRWRVYTDSGCTTGLALVDVVPSGSRTMTATLAGTALTVDSGTGLLSSSDVGKMVTSSGNSALSKARILSVDATGLVATLSVTGTISSPTTVTVSSDPTFLPYSLQLVVWFGA